MHLQATNDFVLLEVHHDNVTPGGIVLPDNAKNPNLTKCRVLSVGPGWYTAGGTRVPCGVKEGQIVYCQPGVREYMLDGKKYALANCRDIMLTANS